MVGKLIDLRNVRRFSVKKPKVFIGARGGGGGGRRGEKRREERGGGEGGVMGDDL